MLYLNLYQNLYYVHCLISCVNSSNSSSFLVPIHKYSVFYISFQTPFLFKTKFAEHFTPILRYFSSEPTILVPIKRKMKYPCFNSYVTSNLSDILFLTLSLTCCTLSSALMGSMKRKWSCQQSVVFDQLISNVDEWFPLISPYM